MARKPNARKGQRKDGGAHKRSRGRGSVGLQDDLLNPEGIFRQILQSNTWKEVKNDMERRRVEREEEEARRNAAAREAEQQRQQQHGKEPKIRTLDAWKRQAMFEEGCTRKEAAGLVRSYKDAERFGGRFVFSDKILSKVAAARRKKSVKDPQASDLASCRRAKQPKAAGSGTRTGTAAQTLGSSRVQFDWHDPDPSIDNADGADYEDGVAAPGNNVMTMYMTQLRTAGLLQSRGSWDGPLLPPRMVHEHDGDAAATIATFAVPHFEFDAATGEGKLVPTRWFQAGFATLANGQHPHFCDCNSLGACALKGVNMERALAYSGAEEVQEGDCIHIDLLKELVSTDLDREEVIERYTLRSSIDIEQDTRCFELGTFTFRDKDRILHQVCLHLGTPQTPDPNPQILTRFA